VIIDAEGRRLLEEAMIEQRETGQQSQQLTDMAHEARRAAQQYVTAMLPAVSSINTKQTAVVIAWPQPEPTLCLNLFIVLM